MSVDTIAINRQRGAFEEQASFWLFGYGSLLYKAGFPYLECRPATIRGWSRRFWQGSHDHRGTPDAPGRVATLVEEAGAVCTGMAYRVTPEVLEPLDVREKNGYLRFTTTLTFTDGGTDQGLVYIATEDNDAFLGPAPALDMAQHIARSAGPSGPNRDYLVGVAAALERLGAEDTHVATLMQALQEVEAGPETQRAGRLPARPGTA
ncbi:gamma-glutamylcyclotransferase [Aquisalimonas asiatica]|uniref:glutathione-specific gamma-glutamylcyclotransferase n=1 Tax=Aquisalimonas asiatica TaxID=406100 RepID=A0A1H8V0Z9_9GAMM|nr:gamma-glutamylcyclotransferase [Aquisalimonas asiatica]SEP09071.1 cation transport protein ChaC [Aquisalimonas asiatica]